MGYILYYLMKKHIIKIFLLLFISTNLLISMYSKENIQDILKNKLKSIEQKINNNLVVSFGNITFENKNIGTSFTRYLENQIQISLDNSKKIEIFSKDKLDEILETARLNLSDLFDEDTIVDIGNLKGIQAIFTGNYFNRLKDVEVFLDLIDIETGTNISSANIIISKTLIPTSINIIPDNYHDALQVIEELQDISKDKKSNLQVKVWTSRGNGGTYLLGENLVVYFFANQDCFIKIYHIDATKSVSLIFPNDYHADNFIKGKKVYKIPDASYGFDFTLGEPFGLEFIKVVASNAQFKEIETAFS